MRTVQIHWSLKSSLTCFVKIILTSTSKSSMKNTKSQLTRKIIEDLTAKFEKLYKYVSTNGKLTLDLFIRLSLDEDANKFFVAVIRDVSSQARALTEQICAKEPNLFAA